MADPSRKLFEERVRSMGEDIVGSSEEVELDSQSGDDVRKNIGFGPDSVFVLSADKDLSTEFHDGLYLVHRLSGPASAALKDATEPQLAQDLSMEFQDLFYDTTEEATNPLPRAAAESWKKWTGLPELSEWDVPFAEARPEVSDVGSWLWLLPQVDNRYRRIALSPLSSLPLAVEKSGADDSSSAH